MVPRPASPLDEAPLLHDSTPEEGGVMPGQDEMREAVSELVSYVEGVHQRVRMRRQKVKDGTDEPRADGTDVRDQPTRKDH